MSFSLGSTATATTPPPRRRRTRAACPKLKESCDCCAAAKVRCTRERPVCLRCQAKGSSCQYSFSRRAGRKTSNGGRRAAAAAARVDGSDDGDDVSSFPGSPVATFSRAAYGETNGDSPPSSFSTPSTPSSSGDEPSHELPRPMPFSSGYGLPELLLFDAPPTLPTPWPQQQQPSYFSETANDRTLADCYSGTTLFDNHHADPFLTFSSSLPAETEAIREDLRLVANYVSTLEERLRRSVRDVEMRQRARRVARMVCGEDEENDDGEWMGIGKGESKEELVAGRFAADGLRRKLGGIRQEIESIVGLG